MAVSTLPAAPGRRVLFLDYARAAATLLMLQGHTIDALLAHTYRASPAFEAWTAARGLTSSTFLFVGGFAFSVVTYRQWAEAGHAPVTWRRLRRFLFFLLLGYAMHYPASSLAAALTIPASAWRPFFAVDVLQCIAVTLTLLQLLAVFARAAMPFLMAAGALTALLVLITPWAWAAAPQLPLPAPALAYVSPAAGSIFPLLPFAAYGTFGAAMGMLFATSSAPGITRRALRSLGPAGVLMVAAAVLARAQSWEPAGSALAGPARPSQFLIQAGLVCLLLVALAAALRLMTIRIGFVEALAQESLTVYVVHVCLVYGSPWSPGLRQAFGPTLSLSAALGWVVVMWVLMALLASLWNGLKLRAPVAASRTRFVVVAALVVFLII